jgi:hypothetical protein
MGIRSRCTVRCCTGACWPVAAAGSLKQSSACGALAISTQIGNQLREAVCWQGLATAAHLRGDLDRAEDWARNGLSLSERVGHLGGILWAWSNLGQVALLRGTIFEAAVCFQHQDAVIAATQRSPTGTALGLGLVACAHGDLVAAAGRCRAARRRSPQDGDTLVEAIATVA